MEDNVQLIVLARKRILERFQTDLQREVLEMSVSDQDVFVIQPKGSGKSLIFKSVPILFDIVRPKCAKPIVHEISLLVLLMLDQVRFLKSLGISAETIGDEQNCEQATEGVHL